MKNSQYNPKPQDPETAPDLPGSRTARGIPATSTEPVSLAAFWRGRRASVSTETAITIMFLVIAFAGVMQIVHSAYVSDRMARAARSAARAIAFVPGADAGSLPGLACKAIRKELGLGEGFDCATKLSVKVENSLAPTGLSGTAGSEHATPSGQLVRVSIAWSEGAMEPRNARPGGRCGFAPRRYGGGSLASSRPRGPRRCRWRIPRAAVNRRQA